MSEGRWVRGGYGNENDPVVPGGRPNWVTCYDSGVESTGPSSYGWREFVKEVHRDPVMSGD